MQSLESCYDSVIVNLIFTPTVCVCDAHERVYKVTSQGRLANFID